VILEPIPTDWRWLDALAAPGSVDDDVIEAVRDEVEPQHLPKLDRLFE
jgi:antitoxin VapB